MNIVIDIQFIITLIYKSVNLFNIYIYKPANLLTHNILAKLFKVYANI
jgi:hypothetical protein